MIKRFSGLAHFVEFAREHGCGRGASGSGHRWDLGISGPEALRMATQGCTSIVPTMVRGMDDFQATFGARARWVTSEAGSVVNMDAFLSGQPEHMMSRVKRAEMPRLTVYASPVGGAMMDAADMMTRGVAILGAIEHLQSIGYAVDLNLLIDTSAQRRGYSLQGPACDDRTVDGNCLLIVPIETRPLDMSTAGFALAHPALFRNVGFDMANLWGSDGGFSDMFSNSGAKDGSDEGCERYTQALRKVLGLAQTDIIIPRVGNRDPMLSDPAGWIAKRVKQALAQ